MSNEQTLRLSPSAVSEYENCPQQYKYRKIDKLPEPPSLDAERGTLVHTVLQDLFEIPAAGRTVDSALDLLPSRWRAQLAEKPALLEMVTNEKEWLDRASSLVKTYFNLENPTTFDGLESIAEIHPSIKSADIFPKMRTLTEDDLYAIAGHILVQPKIVAEKWGGGKIYY